MEKRSIVEISETLRDELGLFPTYATIRRLEELHAHRLALSHTATIKWDGKAKQQFHDEGREYTDIRAAQVWDMQRSINEVLRPAGFRILNEAIVVTPDMAAMLHLMLEAARKPEAETPPASVLAAYMHDAAPRYLAILELHPDGRLVPEP